MAVHVGVSVALANSEGLLNLLDALLWLHTEDLFCYIVVCLVGEWIQMRGGWVVRELLANIFVSLYMYYSNVHEGGGCEQVEL